AARFQRHWPGGVLFRGHAAPPGPWTMNAGLPGPGTALHPRPGSSTRPRQGSLSYSIRFSGESDTAVRKGAGTAVQPTRNRRSRRTGLYCKARQRLLESLLRRLVRDRVNALHEHAQAATDLAEYGMRGRQVTAPGRDLGRGTPAWAAGPGAARRPPGP